jgi:SAM-dependent methyltransferase
MVRRQMLGLGLVLLLAGIPGAAAAQDTRPPGPPAAASAEEQAWREYQAFCQGKDGPAEATAYREHLVAKGMTPEQAWDRIFLIDRLRSRYRQDAWITHFNRLYTTPQEVFDTKPNGFLAAVVRGLKPGAALDVSMGQGRNTVFLASQGWKATGFDPAEDGLVAARAAAARAGVTIEAVNATYDAFDFGEARWDLVVFCYAFAPLSDPALVAKLHRALRPGGLVLIEHPMNDPDHAMHPHDRVNSLPAAYAPAFRILFYEDTTGISEWQQSGTARESDPRRMVRLLARKEPR